MRRLWQSAAWFVIVFAAILWFGGMAAALILVLVADALIIALILRMAREQQAKAAAQFDERVLWLRRRTAPPLRRLRPDRVVEMQSRWRRASEAAAVRRRRHGR